MEFALMLVPGIFGGTKLGTNRTTVSLRLDMFCLNMLPKTSLVLRGPLAVETRPSVVNFAHFPRYFSIDF
jgi:hypothetical protein